MLVRSYAPIYKQLYDTFQKPLEGYNTEHDIASKQKQL